MTDAEVKTALLDYVRKWIDDPEDISTLSLTYQPMHRPDGSRLKMYTIKGEKFLVQANMSEASPLIVEAKSVPK